MRQSIDEHYQHLCQNGTLVHNAFQQEALFLLEDVMERLMRWVQYPRWIQRLFLRQGPKGVYMYGDVGRGKTMLMDLFFEAVPFPQKKRIHFHALMKEVHDVLKEDTPSHKALQDIAKQSRRKASVLCIDDMTVDHIADAMIIQPLFEAFIDQGILLIITSNNAPDDLYAKGLHRDKFIPFITMLEQKLHVFALDGGQDYHHHVTLPRYFKDAAHLHKAFFKLAKTHTLTPKTLTIHAHLLTCIAHHARIAVFTFHDLCEKPTSKEDFLELIHHFDTFFLENVPELKADMTDAAKRFMLLIDILYDAGCAVYLNAPVPIEKLYTDGKAAKDFQRTISRIQELTNMGLHKT
jgi:cell division protein ZapE